MLCLLLVGRKKERVKKREMGLFSPGPDKPCWLCRVGFS
jgi:hypothetical protein